MLQKDVLYVTETHISAGFDRKCVNYEEAHTPTVCPETVKDGTLLELMCEWEPFLRPLNDSGAIKIQRDHRWKRSR